MTGSRAQWYNGMMLLGVFFSCRLIWGMWQSVLVFKDIFEIFGWARELPSTMAPYEIQSAIFGDRDIGLCLDEACIKAGTEIWSFASHIHKDSIPLWLVIIYLGSNLILNTLNVYWFSKMIDAVMKRFNEPQSGKKAEATNTVDQNLQDIVLEAAATLKEEEEKLLMNNGALKEASSEDDKRKIGSRVANGHGGARRRKA